MDQGQRIPVWVTDSQRRCGKAELVRIPDAPNGDPSFVLRRCSAVERDEKGNRIRSCEDEPVGRDWWTSDSGVTEVSIDGSWQAQKGYGIGDPVKGNGILSQVSADAARFRARQVRVSIACEDRTLPCSAGGNHMCLHCRPVIKKIADCPGCAGAHLRSGPAGDACDDPCPPVMDASTQERMEQINDLAPWVVAAPDEPFAGIYRSLKACRADAARFSDLPQTFGEK